MSHQSGIRYVLTEVDLPARAPAPLRVFDLDGLGVDRERFLADLGRSFARLGWDWYDVQREQVGLLKRAFPAEETRLQDFLVRYWQHETTVLEVVDLVRALSWQQRMAFDQIRCYRRRSIAAFTLTNLHSDTWERQWRVVRTECHGFTQDVPGDDPRAIERVFDPTAAEVVAHPEFQRLLVGVAEMTEDAEVGAGRTIDTLSLTFHEMGLVARPDAARTNAPEGRHQDGADYIVSALVVERSNVEGGTSVVTDEAGTRLLEITLQPGQGIFQADAGSPLWHDVTPVRVVRDGQGVRNVLGFDVQVHRC